MERESCFFGRRDFSRIDILEPSVFFADFVTGYFFLIFVGKQCPENLAGSSWAKSSKFYTKIPDTCLQLSGIVSWDAAAIRIGYGFESCDANGPRNVKNTKPAKPKARIFPTLLPVCGQESVLKVPKQRQFIAAISCGTRETDGIVAKLLRCRSAGEALRRNMPLRSAERPGQQKERERETERKKKTKTKRESKRERERDIYIYMYIERKKERERERERERKKKKRKRKRKREMERGSSLTIVSSGELQVFNLRWPDSRESIRRFARIAGFTRIPS